MFSRSVKVPLSFRIIEEDGLHLTIRVRINGKPAVLLIDTGASRTVFDRNRILKFVRKNSLEPNEKISTGLGTNSMKTHSTVLNKVKIGEIVLTEYPALLLDLQHVNASYEKLGLSAIDGVVGSDLLQEYKAVLDYEKKELKLKKK